MINELKETHNQNVDQQNGFHHLLDEMKIPYQEHGQYLMIGEITAMNGWVLYLSARTNCVEELIRKVALVLFRKEVPFTVVKDLSVASRSNDFWRGIDEVGKILTVYSIKEDVTRKLIDILAELTAGMGGPQVNRAVRVRENVYVAAVRWKLIEGAENEAEAVVHVPPPRKVPFKIESKYKYWKKKRLLKRRYVPLVMVGHSPKGDLLKSVDLKGFKFNWCFIKEGKKGAFLDHYGRDIKDRLQWQAKVLSELQSHINVPKPVDFFEQEEECYLVMEWLEGVDLSRKVQEVHDNLSWKELPGDDQKLLLGCYYEIVEMLEKMHALGYVHRDATAMNFMILQSGKIYTIDLELTYNINRNEPDYPFSLGAFGYVAPEQIEAQPPTIKEDVYTLGSLLLHIVTGKYPATFINTKCEVNIEEIAGQVPEEKLFSLILQCLERDPKKRPDLSLIKLIIKERLLK